MPFCIGMLDMDDQGFNEPEDLDMWPSWKWDRVSENQRKLIGAELKLALKSDAVQERLKVLPEPFKMLVDGVTADIDWFDELVEEISVDERGDWVFSGQPKQTLTNGLMPYDRHSEGAYDKGPMQCVVDIVEVLHYLGQTKAVEDAFDIDAPNTFWMTRTRTDGAVTTLCDFTQAHATSCRP